MSWNKRTLRSTCRSPPPSASVTTAISPVIFSASLSSPTREAIQILPPDFKLPGLDLPELTLLRKKQAQLKAKATSLLTTLDPSPHVLTALSATLVFAQHEAGTAVCIDPAGSLLTCSHCIADDSAEWAIQGKRRKWLLYYTGLAVQVECRAWDPQRDLALLKVIAIEAPRFKDGEVGIPSFASVSLSTRPLKLRDQIVCIGQPGRDDLESSRNKRTEYNLVEVSEGRFRGMVPGADPQDNSQIGTLKHDAWTYWGHSGAPLLKRDNGALVGLHSSRDDKTAMRHGIPWVAIEEFLKENFPGGNEAMAGSGDTGRAGVSKKRKLPDENREVGDGGEALAGRRSKISFVDLTGSSPS